MPFGWAALNAFSVTLVNAFSVVVPNAACAPVSGVDTPNTIGPAGMGGYLDCDADVAAPPAAELAAPPAAAVVVAPLLLLLSLPQAAASTADTATTAPNATRVCLRIDSPYFCVWSWREPEPSRSGRATSATRGVETPVGRSASTS